MGFRVLRDQAVQPGEQLGRVQVQQRQSPYGGAQPAHGRGRVHAVAHHVADGQAHSGTGQRDQVEPVAAHAHPAVGRQIAVRHVDRALLRQVLWQQASLQYQGCRVLAGVTAGVVDADGGPFGQFHGECLLLGSEGVGVAAAPEGGQAQDRVAGEQRDEEAGVRGGRSRFGGCLGRGVLDDGAAGGQTQSLQ